MLCVLKIPYLVNHVHYSEQLNYDKNPFFLKNYYRFISLSRANFIFIIG